MALLQAIFVQEAPGVALPTFNLATAPVKDGGHAVGDGGVAADDGEVTAGPPCFGVRNFQAHQVDVGVHPLRPIKVHIALVLLFKNEAIVDVPDLELCGHVALGHGVRLFVQVGPVHRVHDVVEHVAVVTPPFGVAKEGRPFRRGQLFGQSKRRGLVQCRIAGVEQKNGTVRFSGVKPACGPRTFKLATGAAGHTHHGAIVSHLDAVVRAGNSVTQYHAQRQRCAAVWAMVFKCVDLSCGISPKNNFVAQTAQRNRAVLDKA